MESIHGMKLTNVTVEHSPLGIKCTEEWESPATDVNYIISALGERLKEDAFGYVPKRPSLMDRLLSVNGSNSAVHVYPIAKKVVYNDPATVVFWGDGTKTVVKAHDGDRYDERFGLLMALLRKARDNKRYDQYEFLVKTAVCMLNNPDEMDEFANALHGMAAQVRKEENDG